MVDQLGRRLAKVDHPVLGYETACRPACGLSNESEGLEEAGFPSVVLPYQHGQWGNLEFGQLEGLEVLQANASQPNRPVRVPSL